MMFEATSSTRWVQLAIVLFLVTGGSAGTALATHADQPGSDVWHVHHRVEARVVDNYATVRVGVEIVNEGPDPEFPFRVEIPDDAYVTGLNITRDGETYEAEIQRAQQAREDYEEAKRQGRSAGIVEKDRDASVYRYNVNVEGTETVKAVLTYQSYLTADAGVYELPLTAPATQRGIDEGASFRVQLQHASGLDEAWSIPGAHVSPEEAGLELTREVDPRGQGQASEMTVRYEPEATSPGGRLVTAVENGTGYFAHRFRSPAQGRQAPVEMSLVLDTSGSMRGVKLDQLKQATRQVIRELNASDRLHVTSFSHEATSTWEGFRAVDANTTRRALEAVDRLGAGGSTDIEAALQEGLAPFGNETQRGGDRLPVVVFLTDGKATDGIQDDERLREVAREANAADAHVFSLAFGADADWPLVHGLAEDGDGLARRIETGQGAEVDLSSFLTALTSPVLTNVTVDYPNASVEAWQIGSPVLFAGGELVYVGTFDSNTSALNATVTARRQGSTGSWNVSEPVLESGPAYLPDMVAFQRVQALERRIDAEGASPGLVENATRLALEQGFVTERTSLEVDLPSQRSEDDTHDDADDGSPAAGGPGGGHARDTDDQADHDRADTSHTAPPDADGDGVPDTRDNCPNTANAGQADQDGDGRGDACDRRDNRDADGDGRENALDACPRKAGPTGNDGCPEEHADGPQATQDAQDQQDQDRDSSGSGPPSQGGGPADQGDRGDARQPQETPSVGLVILLAVMGLAAAASRRR